MSIKERKEEAEAVLDSAEMLLDTLPPGAGGAAKRDLEAKLRELEQEIQEPDSENSLKKLIKKVRDLMQDLEEEAAGSSMELGPEEEMGGMGPREEPEDDLPPF